MIPPLAAKFPLGVAMILLVVETISAVAQPFCQDTESQRKTTTGLQHFPPTHKMKMRKHPLKSARHQLTPARHLTRDKRHKTKFSQHQARSARLLMSFTKPIMPFAKHERWGKRYLLYEKMPLPLVRCLIRRIRC